MSASAAMKDLLRPLRVYRLENSFLEMELESTGAALDAVGEYLEETQREMCLVTAQDAGLEAVKELTHCQPVAETPRQLATALMALLRIGVGSATPAAINDTAVGCGLNALVAEGQEPGMVQVRFPGVRGIPNGMGEIRSIIEEILPAHVRIEYKYCYQMWSQLNLRRLTWTDLHEDRVTWDDLEKMAE